MTWALPGGKLNTDESPVTALAREIEEELGGRINDPILVQIDRFVSQDKKFTYTTYFAPVDDEFVPLLNGEHLGYAWLPLESAPYPLHPGIHRTIKNQSVMDKIAKCQIS